VAKKKLIQIPMFALRVRQVLCNTSFA